MVTVADSLPPHKSHRRAFGAQRPTTPAQRARYIAESSVNCHVTLAGRQVLVTLRDTDKTRLLDRLTTRLARFLVPATPTPAGASTSLSAAQPTPEGWCGVHGVQMQLHHGKDGRTWYSHKTADRWCKGR